MVSIKNFESRSFPTEPRKVLSTLKTDDVAAVVNIDPPRYLFVI